jgi:hypothetical protein
MRDPFRDFCDVTEWVPALASLRSDFGRDDAKLERALAKHSVTSS